MVTSLLKKLNLNFLSKLSVMGAIQSFNKMAQGFLGKLFFIASIASKIKSLFSSFAK